MCAMHTVYFLLSISRVPVETPGEGRCAGVSPQFPGLAPPLPPCMLRSQPGVSCAQA